MIDPTGHFFFAIPLIAWAATAIVGVVTTALAVDNAVNKEDSLCSKATQAAVSGFNTAMNWIADTAAPVVGKAVTDAWDWVIGSSSSASTVTKDVISGDGTIAVNPPAKKTTARSQAKPKAEGKDKTITDTATDTTKEPENPIFIYRMGNYTNTNLTPRAKDITGLSFSTIKPVSGNYVVTTMKAINSTGRLVAIQDSPTHVSVLPLNISEMDDWIESRNRAETNPHSLTTILKSISSRGF